MQDIIIPLGMNLSVENDVTNTTPLRSPSASGEGNIACVDMLFYREKHTYGMRGWWCEGDRWVLICFSTERSIPTACGFGGVKEIGGWGYAFLPRDSFLTE